MIPIAYYMKVAPDIYLTLHIDGSHTCLWPAGRLDAADKGERPALPLYNGNVSVVFATVKDPGCQTM